MTPTGTRSNQTKPPSKGASGLVAVIVVLAALISLPSCDCWGASAVPTASPTLTQTATPAPTPEPTPTPTHPLMIDVMRERSYPGSDIVIEEELEPGSNYNRYIASYQSEGLTIYALMTVPRGERPGSGWPAVIFNHGYIPPDEYRTTERYVAYVDAFAASGYVVFKPDYRGHGDSEGQVPIWWYVGPDYTVDVLNAVASVQRYPDADRDRIGMWGHSMGGAITLRAMVVTGDVKAGVIWAGVVAPYAEIFEWWGEGWWLGQGSVEQNPGFWASLDPITYLDDLSGPIQLHHGSADSVVPVEQSENLYASLGQADAAAELCLYEGDDHNISNNLWTALQRSIEFFDLYVKGADCSS